MPGQFTDGLSDCGGGFVGWGKPVRWSDSRANVRFWHKADIPTRSINVRFWGKADITRTYSNVRF